MKILIVLHTAKKGGGLVLQILNLAKIFERNGHHVEIFSFDSYSDGKGIVAGNVLIFKSLKMKIKKFKPSIILTSDAYITTIPVIIAAGRQIPIVSRAGSVYHAFFAARVAEYITPNNAYNSIFYVLKKILKFVSKFTYGRLDGVIFNSRFLQEKYKESTKKSIVIHNGVVFNAPTKIGTFNPIRLVFLGRIDPRKTLELVIESAFILKSRKNKFKLTIIGGTKSYPDYYKKINRLVIENGLEKHIDFLGELKNKDVPAILQQQDILLFTTDDRNFPITEGLPNVLLEGMANGLFIITTSVAGVPEIITKDNGFIVKPNPKEITEKVELVIKNKKLLLQTKKKNLEYIKKNHLLENTATQYLRVFEQVIRNRK